MNGVNVNLHDCCNKPVNLHNYIYIYIYIQTDMGHYIFR